MTDDTKQGQPAATGSDNVPKETAGIIGWSDLYAHLQEGYRNAQETIRAIDTKVSILTGLSVFALTAVGGVLGSAGSCLGDHPEYFRLMATAPLTLLTLGAVLAIAAVVSLILGITCIILCLGALRARSRLNGLSALDATVLFPCLPARGRLSIAEWFNTHRPAKDYYDRIITGDLRTHDLQKEYHDQILNVAAILGEKMDCFGRASLWFRNQMISAGIVLITLLLLMVGIGITHWRATHCPSGATKAGVHDSGLPVLRQAP